jgi:N utilization substance protein A
MPAVQRSEFFLALNQVATERGVDVKVIIDAVKNAILAAYRKDHPDIVVEEYEVTLNPNSGEARVMHSGEDVTPPGFGRIAAQTAKQVILQKVREEEKQAILADYKLRIGTVMNGMVLRFAGPNIIVDLGKAEAIMPVSEQIPHEQYRVNQRLTVYLVEIREGVRGQELVVSRAHNGLLEGLFRREVPEIAQGSVVIEKIAREPGIRSKVAVKATQGGIDPVGSCVGQRGVRVQAVIQEVGNEKIDVIPFETDPETFIRLALAPAKDMTVKVNEKDKTADVAVSKEELSSAIGKDGQNVRLAGELTGFKINILEGASKVPVEEPKETSAESKTMVDKEETKEEKVQTSEEEAKVAEAPVQATDGSAEPAEETQQPSESAPAESATEENAA